MPKPEREPSAAGVWWMPASVAGLEAVEATALADGVWTQGGDLRWEVVEANPRGGGGLDVELAVENLTGATVQINRDTTRVAVLAGGVRVREDLEEGEGFALQEEDPGNWAYDSTDVEAGETQRLRFVFDVEDPQDLRIVVGVVGYAPVAFDTAEP